MSTAEDMNMIQYSSIGRYQITYLSHTQCHPESPVFSALYVTTRYIGPLHILRSKYLRKLPVFICLSNHLLGITSGTSTTFLGTKVFELFVIAHFCNVGLNRKKNTCCLCEDNITSTYQV